MELPLATIMAWQLLNLKIVEVRRFVKIVFGLMQTRKDKVIDVEEYMRA